VAVVIVEAFIGSLNDTVMTATPVAPLRGLVELTVGARVSVGFVDESHPAITTTSTASGHAEKHFVRRYIDPPDCRESECKTRHE
jgi:hypothetical protein